MKQWYEELFRDYAEAYDKEPYTQGTIGEVDFIETEIGFDKAKVILDIGCGTGRHAIELAKRGYRVTGIDLSQSQLRKARDKAKHEQVKVDFIQKDARDISFRNSFDVVIMLCEGAFSLMETDEMNYRILQNAERSLKKGGKLIFTTLSVLYPLYHSVQERINSGSENVLCKSNSFNLLEFRGISTMSIVDDSAQEKTLECNERYYAPSEIAWYLKSLGFKNIDICGCKLGAFSRSDKLTVDDIEMLVIAEK